jgi:ABC-type multidrug transport system permease subunit
VAFVKTEVSDEGSLHSHRREHLKSYIELRLAMEEVRTILILDKISNNIVVLPLNTVVALLIFIFYYYLMHYCDVIQVIYMRYRL